MKRIYVSNNIVSILFSVLIMLMGCDNGNRKADSKKHKKLQQSVGSNQTKAIENTNLASFVLSCGSGCAITYTPENVTGTLPVLIVKFKVEMFVDEELTDTYNEVYEFSYDSSKQIERVQKQGEHDDVLKTLMPNAQKSFEEFAEQLKDR